MSLSQKYWMSVDEKINEETRNILNEHLLNLKLSNKTEATITRYKTILEGFLKECPKRIADLKAEEVYTWLQAYQVDKKQKTMELVLSALSSFFKFCIKEEYLDRMFLIKRWRPKILRTIPNTLPKYLNEPELGKVLREADQLSLRDRGIILFLFSSFCRTAELAHLRMKDIDLEKRTAWVGKGKKIRRIHFSIECAIILKEYLRTRSVVPEDPLFLNRWGKPLGQVGIYNVVKKIGQPGVILRSLRYVRRIRVETYQYVFTINFNLPRDEKIANNIKRSWGDKIVR